MSKSICVYCASSPNVPAVYLDTAARLGALLAASKLKLIYGAGETGLMGALATAMLKNNGIVTGVIPRFMKEHNWHHKNLEQIIVTETMHERKALMASMCDIAVALPGGCGTIEELMEVITWKQLGLFQKPIYILNTNGYYDPLIKMLEQAIREEFMNKEHAILWTVIGKEQDLIDAINSDLNPSDSSFNFSII